jgi:type VI secretion system protein ImpK
MDVFDELTRDCFGAIMQLRRMGEGAVPDPQPLYTRLCGYVDALVQRGRAAQVSQDDLGDLVYAIAALADEVALAIPQAHAVWMSASLQLRYFNENLAGENFFRRLETLRQTPARYGVLRIYYTCLLLGFQGRFRVRGAEQELEQLTEQVRLDLTRHRLIEEEVLSPRGGRPSGETGPARRHLPVLGFSLAALGVALLVNVSLHWSLTHRGNAVVRRIVELAGARPQP